MAETADYDQRFNIVNEKTHANVYLSAHFKPSLAYYTLHDRVPRIITEVIDHLSRYKDDISSKLGEKSREEMKQVIGGISQLKYELQTDKEFAPFEETSEEFKIWNQFLSDIEGYNGKKSYFSTPWLYAECYLYRRLKLIFEQTETLKDYDYFKEQKDNTLISTLPTVKLIASFLETHKPNNEDETHSLLLKLMKLNLWGNRVDLSLTGGQEVKMVEDPFEKIKELEAMVLVDDTEEVWKTLKPLNGNVHVEIINDNAGYELFVDVILADFLLDAKLAKKVVFNLKACPWFVSDALEHDFRFLIDFLKTSDYEPMQRLGQKWEQRWTDGDFAIQKVDTFWTTGYEFPKMKEVDPNLYNRLTKADLLIFKGDLNYRKLLSDINWDPTTPFKDSLKGFLPTKLVSLRTVKADLISGLPAGKAESLEALNPTWMKDGDYGVIQFASN